MTVCSDETACCDGALPVDVPPTTLLAGLYILFNLCEISDWLIELPVVDTSPRGASPVLVAGRLIPVPVVVCGSESDSPEDESSPLNRIDSISPDMSFNFMKCFT